MTPEEMNEAWEWFAATMMHDLGKTIIDKDGVFHQETLDPSQNPALKLGEIDFDAFLRPGVVSKISASHGVDVNRPIGQVALVIADRVQKVMHRMTDAKRGLIDDERGNKDYAALKNYPVFYPYYGHPKKRVDSNSAAEVLRDVKKVMAPAQGNYRAETLLAAQRRLRYYPHTSYIPHISLEVHHRFAGAIFVFAWRRLAELQSSGRSFADLKQLPFHVIACTPDPLQLFYRLRDVKAQQNAVNELRRDLHDAMFANSAPWLTGLSVGVSPFEFYTGDSLVVVYDDADIVLSQIQASADRRDALRSLAIEVITYSAPLSWNEKGVLETVRVEAAALPDIHQGAVIAPDIKTFPGISLERCRRCNEPMAEGSESGLCVSCRRLMERGMLDLEKVAGDERLAYVFITLPGLREHARQVGTILLKDAKADRAQAEWWKNKDVLARLAAAPDLRPTEQGLFEYLQAVMAVDDLRRDLEVTDDGKGRDDVHRIAGFPELLIYVMPESRFLDFFEHLDSKLKLAQFDVGVRMLLCDLRTPIWSLMDRFASGHEPGRFLYDTTGGEVTMFTDDEVKAIRMLARSDPSAISRAQLQALIQQARKGGLEELKLEIDRRHNKHKIKAEFARALKEKLDKLTPSESKLRRQNEPAKKLADQNKRALFIKNIADLGNFKPQ